MPCASFPMRPKYPPRRHRAVPFRTIWRIAGRGEKGEEGGRGRGGREAAARGGGVRRGHRGPPHPSPPDRHARPRHPPTPRLRLRHFRIHGRGGRRVSATALARRQQGAERRGGSDGAGLGLLGCGERARRVPGCLAALSSPRNDTNKQTKNPIVFRSTPNAPSRTTPAPAPRKSLSAAWRPTPGPVRVGGGVPGRERVVPAPPPTRRPPLCVPLQTNSHPISASSAW